MHRRRLLDALVVVALSATLLVALAAGGEERPGAVPQSDAAAWRGLVGAERTAASVGSRVLVVLEAPSLATRLARAGGLATERQERAWTTEAFAAQQQAILALVQRGVALRPEFRYTRVLNGFSAVVDARGLAVLERAPEVAGVYPVRAAFPASVSSRILDRGAFAPQPLLAGFDGLGVTIALLDTGVDLDQPYLLGRVDEGYDVIADLGSALPQRNPQTGETERHGTEMAGILVGAGGPGGLEGIAPGARVLPIRVAGWQRADGGYAVYARTDQVIAGLERAVDPNSDGDAHDAVRVALIPLAEPYAAFTHGPLARAIAGALALDVLVVVPAGNDGPAGPAFGSVAGPGGAPAALTVGAADLRPLAAELRVVLRVGLGIELDRVVPVAGALAPRGVLRLPVAAPRENRADAIGGFFDEDGYSLVAGRAALVPAGSDPLRAAERAARAGAAVVVLYGDRLPPGGIGLREGLGVPVVAIPARAARAALASLRAGRAPELAVGAVRARENGGARRVAPFSSRGLSFGGALKPDLVAPGVGLVASDPGSNDDGTPRFVTVNGSSAAAAVAAGAAALVLQARPALDARTLRSVLVGSARPLGGEAVVAQGAGLLDAGAAVTAEIAAAPATLAFGRADGAGWRSSRTVTVRNVSRRDLTVYVGSGQSPARRPALRVTVTPSRLVLPAGGSAEVRVHVAQVRGSVGRIGGTVTLTPVGARPLRVPWVAVVGPRQERLIGGVELSATTLKRRAGGTTPVLTLRAGRVLDTPGGVQVQPVERLDVELWTPRRERRIGLLARVRELLPGRYAFGITGRGPRGGPLPRGRYLIRLVAVPAAGGRPSVAYARFRIE